MNSKLPANVAAAANPAAVYGSVPGGAALIIYGFGTNAAGARPAENTPAMYGCYCPIYQQTMHKGQKLT